jgi:hypothetical protein
MKEKGKWEKEKKNKKKPYQSLCKPEGRWMQLEIR